MLVGLYCMHLFIYHRGTAFSFNSISLLPRELVTAQHVSSSVWRVIMVPNSV